MGGAARARRRELPRAARLPARALRLLPREARRVRGRPRGDREAAAHREGRASGDAHARQPDRLTSLRRAVRDRSHLLDERHHWSTELHPADGERPRELGHRVGTQLRGLGHRRRPAHRQHVQRRPVRRRRGSRRVRSHRPDPHPGRHGQHRAPDQGDRGPRAGGRRAHAVVRGVPRRELRPSRLERRARPRGGGARRRRAGLSVAKLEQGWGAKVTEAMGIGDIGVSLWGECEEQDGMHLGARGFVHRRADRPRNERGDRARRRRERRARADASSTSRGAAPALPHA